MCWPGSLADGNGLQAFSQSGVGQSIQVSEGQAKREPLVRAFGVELEGAEGGREGREHVGEFLATTLAAEPCLHFLLRPGAGR